MISRADRTPFSEWWWTVDKSLLAGFVALMIGGVVLSLAGSPAVAERLGYDSYHFVNRHLFFFLPALAVLVATSFLSPRQARRIALVLLVVSLALMLAVLLVGTEINGSRRWITIMGLSVQPSEFMKPAFVVIVAWLFAENARRPDIPGNLFALILLGIVVALLIAEPDFGQTMLVAIAWGSLFFMAGVSVGCLNRLLAVTTQVTIAEVIHHDVDDVGRRCRGDWQRAGNSVADNNEQGEQKKFCGHLSVLSVFVT